MRSGPSSARSKSIATPGRRRPRGGLLGPCGLDPEHRLVVSVVVGKRTEAHARQVVHEFRERTDGRPSTHDLGRIPAYAAAIQEMYGEPEAGLPEWLVYATVHKVREQERVVRVKARVVSGRCCLAAALVWAVLGGVNTAFVDVPREGPGRNSRKVRKT